MSEQAKILDEMQSLIMTILQNGSASVEEGNKLDDLEDLLHQQRSFKKSSHKDYDIQGEEIAALFFNDEYEQGIDKLYEYKISSSDFFGFLDYHYDEEDEEEFLSKFTHSLREKINKDYALKCESK